MEPRRLLSPVRTRSSQSGPRSSLLALAGLSVSLLPALLPAPARADVVTATVDTYFDAATSAGWKQGYRVVGSYVPPSWSWGKIELLEGYQKFRTEGYNLRTEKLRWQDTYSEFVDQNKDGINDYPVQQYFGDLNQQLVDGFNLFYKSTCVGKVGTASTTACTAPGPTRPDARLVLLQIGPKTAAGSCDKTKAPVLLVHGAMQDGNVWLFPGGNDGKGGAYPGTTQKTGLVQYLESNNYCTFAVTFGNFHGDNYSQAINMANAMARVKTLIGRATAKVNVVAWSKGVLPVDLYAANASTWTDYSTTAYFETIAKEQGKWVPTFRKDIRTYVALSGPHLGIDLNFRHPYDDLLIYSTAENAPVGRGPVTSSWMSAMQCVTWGYSDSPTDLYPNFNADGLCEGRGGMWPDYWTRIYTSNITGLDSQGRPVYSGTLKNLNVTEGVNANTFNFDAYNIAMWGSVNDAGKFVSPYLGQLQTAYNLLSYYDVRHPSKNDPACTDDGLINDWDGVDPDVTYLYPWLDIKTTYYPYPPYTGAGWLEDTNWDECRYTGFYPTTHPCRAQHLYYLARNAYSYLWGYAEYGLMSGIGIDAAAQMGGNFINRLKSKSLASTMDFLYVLYGTAPGTPDQVFETDGLQCPSSTNPHGDGVLFDVSIDGRFLTQSWTQTTRDSKFKAEGMPRGHLEMGVSPDAWAKILTRFQALP